MLFTINDLLVSLTPEGVAFRSPKGQLQQDLTRLESGGETSFSEPFNLHTIVHEATMVYRNEAARRGLHFEVDVSKCPEYVVGDAKKIRTVVANLTANAREYHRTWMILYG